MQPGKHQGELDLSRQKTEFTKAKKNMTPPVCSTRIPTAAPGAVSSPVRPDGVPRFGSK